MKSLVLVFLFVIFGLAIARRHRKIDENDVKEFLESRGYEFDDDEDEQDAVDEINEEEDMILNDRQADALWNNWRWRPRIGGMIKRNIILRALKPTCAGCAGICERKVPGRCACTKDYACWNRRFGKK